MAWAEHVHFFLDDQTFGGVVHERLLAAIVRADGLYCGLVFGLGTTGAPTVECWERIDDLERSGFTSIPLAKARAISDALPRFLDQLERAEGAVRQAPNPHATRPSRARWSAYDPALESDRPAVPPEFEARLERQKANTLDRDAYEGG